MTSDNNLYQRCLPILQDSSLDDDDRAEKLEDFVKADCSLSGKELETAVLDILWRFRTSNNDDARPSSRHTVIRRASPAPWQVGKNPTPTASPRPLPSSLNRSSSSAILRNRSSTASPFTSPRASPRLAFVTPFIPHSPRLDAYQPYSEASGTSPTDDSYEDMGSESVEWLVGDDARSNASTSLAGEAWYGGDQTQQQAFMDPLDLLRSIFGDELTNEAITKSLEDNGYDIAATMSSLIEAHGLTDTSIARTPGVNRTVLVGKSMSPNVRPATPVGQQRSTVVCRYWLASGQCARADCRFSHDTSGTVCKYWLQGNCLAGNTCAFSHDPTGSMARITQEGVATPPVQPSFQEYDFPTLQPAAILTASHISPAYALAFEQYHGSLPGSTSSSSLNPLASFTPSSQSRQHSRPSSRHTSRAPTPSVLAVDDNDAFPSLGAAAAGKQKKHHGRRGGHGHGANKDSASSLAEVVRSAPSPTPPSRRGNTKLRGGLDRGLSATALSIPAPQNLPWVESGEANNKAYIKARNEAFRHANQRNKLLQGAAQAYNRHDTRAAKALSLRGQAENNLMREAHRKAAQVLYEERNKDTGSTSRELYVDLHGLHAEEAVDYLSRKLRDHERDSPMRPIYAITGTGHHSRNGKDKIGKAVRAFLADWRYAYREFNISSGPDGARTGAGAASAGLGGVIGVDPTSWDRSLDREADGGGDDGVARGGPVGQAQSTKLVILRKEDIELAAASGNVLASGAAVVADGAV